MTFVLVQSCLLLVILLHKTADASNNRNDDILARRHELHDILSHRQLLVQSRKDYGQCNECYCTVDNDGDACPATTPASLSIEQEQIDNLKLLTLNNPLTLDCDPYELFAECKPFSNTDGDCYIVNVAPTQQDSIATCPQNYTYELATLTTATEDAVMTHPGACGVCSSLQDLATYIEWGPLFREKVSFCGLLDDFIPEASVYCLQDLGLTESCSWMWYYHTVNTESACLDLCIKYYLFGPVEDTCETPDCVSCEIDSAYTIMVDYAGRTLINSGVLEEVTYPCSQVQTAPATIYDPCSSAATLTDERTEEVVTGQSTTDRTEEMESDVSPWLKFVNDIRVFFGLEPYSG